MPFDDEIVDAPSGNDAIDDDESLSPDISDTDDDDDSVDADDADRSGKAKAKGGDTEALRKQVEELEKRFQGSTLSWKEAERRREEAERRAAANEQRLQKWQKYGVNPEEIDRLIAQQEGQAGGPAAGQQQFQLPEDLLTRDQLSQALAWQEIRTKWETQKEGFLERAENKLFDSKGWRKWMDDEAMAIAQDEIDRFGQVSSGPKEVWKKVQERLNEMRGGVEKAARKAAGETREKVNSQGIVESSQKKRRRTETDTDDESRPWTREAYIETFTAPLRKFKEGG